MNWYYLSVGCPFCSADRHQPCVNTMLPDRPPTETHQARIDYADETSF